MVSVDRLDGVTAAEAIKAPCRAATTANITLSGLQTVDGVSLVADDRVLVKDQTAGAENGIYLVKSTTWERAPDWDGNRDVTNGTVVHITDGSVNTRLVYSVITANPITIGTTSITFTNLSTVVGNFFPTALNVLDYGAVGDDSTDDTTAFTNALAVSASSGNPLYVPPGIYKLTSTIGYTDATIIHMFGAGPDKSVLKMYTDNTPILNVGYGRSRVADLSLQYSSAQAIGNTNANCIDLYACNYSVFERLTFYRCNRGMYIPQVDAYLGANYIFSCTIRDIFCTYYSNSGMDLTCYNGGSSGNVMSNIYLIGRDDGTTKLETNFALTLGGWANSVVTQLNIESSKPTQALYLNTCEAMMFDGLHFEQVECRTDYGGLVEISGGAHEFRGVHVSFCQISVTNLLSLFRLTAINTKVRAVNVQERNNTITSTHWRLFVLPGTETGVEAYCEMLIQSGFTSNGSSASYPSKIRQVGTYNYVVDIGGNSIISASSVPATGTWVLGDKCFNSAPATGEPLGWICTSGGSPGTWQAFGVLDGFTSFNADNPMTFTAGTTGPNTYLFGTLTAGRAVTLSGGFLGAHYRVTRVAGGAFNVDVGGLKNLAANEWCDVSHDGSSWVLMAYGSL